MNPRYDLHSRFNTSNSSDTFRKYYVWPNRFSKTEWNRFYFGNYRQVQWELQRDENLEEESFGQNWSEEKWKQKRESYMKGVRYPWNHSDSNNICWLVLKYGEQKEDNPYIFFVCVCILICMDKMFSLM